eukprot:jgi/Botrbrau1/22860/Bobra.0065s0018.1
MAFYRHRYSESSSENILPLRNHLGKSCRIPSGRDPAEAVGSGKGTCSWNRENIPFVLPDLKGVLL